MIRAVFFDVGETLIDETRLWGDWADWLGVPRRTMFAALGATIARGEDHRRAFDLVRPGIDLDAEVQARRAATAGSVWFFRTEDLYPDAVPCLEALRDSGLRTGLAGNLSDPEAISSLDDLQLPIDDVSSSASLGAEKPSPAFFAGISALTGLDPAEIAYVGDRVDNDVVPAAEVGMFSIWLRRVPGPQSSVTIWAWRAQPPSSTRLRCCRQWCARRLSDARHLFSCFRGNALEGAAATVRRRPSRAPRRRLRSEH